MEKIVKGNGCRLLLHPGRGKTGTVLKAFQILKNKGVVDALLVLAPLRVITTSWPSELGKWSDFDTLNYTTIHGGSTERRAAMSADVDVYLMNFEGLLSKEWARSTRTSYEITALAQNFLAGKRFMLAVDESTRLKNPTGRRFKILKQYLPRFSHVTIMTGTPKPSKLEDLFAQCYLTDRGRDLGQYITHFRRRYMMPAHNGFGYDARPGALQEVAAAIADTTVQYEYEPAVPSSDNYITAPVPQALRTQYDQLRREFLTRVEGTLVMAPNAGVLFGKLRQFAQGAMYDVDGDGSYTVLHDAKIAALLTLIAELDGDPLLVMVQYKHDVERINAALVGERYNAAPYIGSWTSVTAAREAVAAFSAGTLPVLLGHPNSLAHGVDGLQNSCRNLCWFAHPDSWELYYQGNLRIIRSGSTAEHVYIHHIQTDLGIEAALQSLVQDKHDTEAEFLARVRELL